MALDLKIKDVEGKHHLWFNAQGKDDHTQLDFGFTVTDDEGKQQYDFSFDDDDLWVLAKAINHKLGFEIFDIYNIEKMHKAYETAWEEKNNEGNKS